MEKRFIKYSAVYIPLLVLGNVMVVAQNPVIRDQFTADPSARVFEGRVYLFPSHDVDSAEGKGRKGWFCMEDYHVFSSSDLTHWTDHGVIICQNRVSWVDSTKYSMWAPDCIFRNGKFYFYYPALAKDTIYGKGFSIGVAVSEQPYGPFVPQPEPIKNVHGIDPNVFIDKDGQAYMYWSARKFYVAKLKENMLELDSEPLIIPNLPEKGLKEGPYLFERNGTYYLTFPHVENITERIEYAIGTSPMGPFTMTGVIMDESPTGCWTSHHSIVQFNEQWYLFYHDNDLSPRFDKNRSVRVDSLFFNADGTIRKVIPTLRGVGLTKASERIQMDRFSAKSEKGASVQFLDSLNTYGGWKVILDSMNTWVQYNAVDFGKEKYRRVQIKASARLGSTLQIRLDKADGMLISEIKIPADPGWITIDSRLLKSPKEIQNLIALLIDNNPVEIDWISLE